MERGYLDMQLLRFSTAGSVDDGKSTLIGRLLYDSKSIFEDQLEAVEEASRSRGNEEVNLALLTDGLRAKVSPSSTAKAPTTNSKIFSFTAVIISSRTSFHNSFDIRRK